jgi:transposase InsO family protein
MHVHSNAQTTPKGRLAMIGSALSCRALALRYNVSLSTAHRWRNREGCQDRSSRPNNPRLAMDPTARQAALLLRAQGLTLDECFDALRPVWTFSRATLHRFFVSQGLGHQRPDKAPPKAFKEYEPGYVHIDCTYLPKMENQARFAFVAIDRATRLAFVKLFDKRNMANATTFLVDAIDFFPFNIHRVLTDNGAEFTNRFFKRWPKAKVKAHPFETELARAGISHRLTRPYTPKTNGMVERFNRLIKDNTLGKGRYESQLELESDMLTWNRLYNLHRKHSGIQRRTPLQQAQRWYILKPEIFTRDPDSLKAFAFSTS